MLYSILKPIAVALMRLLFRVEGRGAEHIPAEGPVLIVANHSSVLDPPLVGGMCPRQLTYLAKAELFRVPGLGGLIRRLGAQPLRREGADPSALRTAQRVLAEGKALLVFPEGTRGEEGDAARGQAGRRAAGRAERGDGRPGVRQWKRASVAPRASASPAC